MKQKIEDHNPKIITNLIVFKRIDLTPVKIILMKEILKTGFGVSILFLLL